MASRFISNLLVLLAGAFLACAAFAFTAGTIAWIALGIGATTLLAVLCAFAVRGRGTTQRAFDACIVLTATWTVVASRVFAAGDQKWLSFAGGAVLVLFAFAGLVVHEVLMELTLARRLAPPGNGRVADAQERPALGAVR
jgi:hypothetical protein